MNSTDLRTLTALVRREFQLGTRGPLFWALVAIGGLYALWRALDSEGSLALACFQVVQFAVVGLGLAGVLLGGMAAGRDARDRSREVVLAKSLGNRPLLVTARFLGVWLSLLAVVVLMLLAVLLTELLSRGPAWGLATYGNALLRAALPLALATALGFALTTLFATPLASVIAAVYWIAVPLARAHVSSIFDVTVTQHWAMVLPLAAAFVALSGWKYGQSIVGVTRRAMGLLALALFGLAALAVLGLLGRGDDALAEPDPVLAAISGQSLQGSVRAPGFWLPDAHQRVVGLDDFAGRPVLLLFWAPSSPGSAAALPVLRSLAAKARADDLACVAVCVDHDAATLAPFARELDGDVTMVWDQGRHFNPVQPTLDSALVTAYDVEQTPAAFLLDRRHAVVQTLAAVEPEDLAPRVLRALAERKTL